jgi:signal transduction histidine kinase
MRVQFDTRTERNRLRLLLGVFFLALAVPAIVLVQQAFKQLELDAFRRYQLLAEEFSERIDQSIAEAVRSEDARRFTDYGFLIVAGDPEANFLQQSPLAAFPVTSAVPGVIGYFQIDSSGSLSTPLLPSRDVDPSTYGISREEQAERAALELELRAILSASPGVRVGLNGAARLEPARTQLAVEGRASTAVAALEAELDDAKTENAPVRARVGDEQGSVAPAIAALEDTSAQSAGGRADIVVTGNRIERDQPQAGLVLSREALDSLLNAAESDVAQSPRAVAPSTPPAAESARQEFAAAPLDERSKRIEQSSAPEPATQRITMFESEVDPHQFTQLQTGHLLMFRNVWRDGERLVQGAVIDSPRFIEEAVAKVFAGVALSATTSLQVRYRDAELAILPGASVGAADPYSARPLYSTRLSPPLADLELAYLAGPLPLGPGRSLLVWVSVVLAAVLLGGFFVMYRFGMRQITLRGQQQDFVSAVSHELKTPLTSIRMYGEMLQAGWAGEDKKRTYYAYIAEESERLSRLIENVLALARMNRGDARLELVSATVGDLLDMVRSKVATALERAGFTLSITLPDDLRAATLRVDRDAFAQIFINLVDNALKFAARAERKEIAIAVRSEGRAVLFCVRDYGPGVPRGKMKKLFELFYRPEDELTRTTTGTGIGLGLVKQLATAMHASVDVRNCEPGAEFRLLLPTVADAA